MTVAKIGFLGAGGIARAHAFSLNALKYYYPKSILPQMVSVCSQREESRAEFAAQYGFEKHQSYDEFLDNKNIDTVFILGPNKVHAPHIKDAVKMSNVKRIYVEKPVCSSLKEEQELASLNLDGKLVQIGFQFLQNSAIIRALKLWTEADFGKPIHFSFKYLHAEYLKKSYREKRTTRLTPAPDGGAMADLGSHVLSLLIAFLGDNLQISSAIQGGSYPDVNEGSDLFSEISLVDTQTGAVGHLNASRISAGVGDSVSFEIYAENGAIRYSSYEQDYFEYYLEKEGKWVRDYGGSDFSPYSVFPSARVPSGWLRSMIHAHFLFLNEPESAGFVPDLSHGLQVQRLVRETADHLVYFREKIKTYGKK